MNTRISIHLGKKEDKIQPIVDDLQIYLESNIQILSTYSCKVFYVKGFALYLRTISDTKYLIDKDNLYMPQIRGHLAVSCIKEIIFNQIITIQFMHSY